MPKKKLHTVRVSVAGRDFRLSTDEDDAYVRRLAEAVTDRIFALRNDSGASTLDSAVLTAFCLADELTKATAKPVTRQEEKKPAAEKSNQDKTKPE